MDKNPRIAEIEEKQEELRKKAKEAHEKGDAFFHRFLLELANLLESDKLFVCSPTLLETYHSILKNTEIEVNGMKWPVGVLIGSTKKSCWQRSDLECGQVFVRGKEKFRVVGIADEPTVTVENIETGEREHHVISSPNFSEFRKMERGEAND